MRRPNGGFPRTPRTRWSRAALVGAALACGLPSAPSVAPPAGPGLHVLFVGNSLTYVNDVPGIVEALADSAGVPLDARSVAFPDYSLDDHWADGTALRSIDRRGWDVVVLQQGPSALPDSRVLLLAAADRFAARIRAAGARPAFYAAWPSQGRAFDYPASAQSYRLAAQRVSGDLYPVSRAWALVMQRDTSQALYATDGLHASVAGSYLAALVIFGGLAHRSPTGLPVALRLRSGAALELTPGVGALLQQAASDALAEVWGVTAPSRR